MNNDFKVGDKVRIASLGSYIRSREQGLVLGNTGVITEVDDSGDPPALLLVRTDNADEPVPPGDVGWSFWPNELEKVED